MTQHFCVVVLLVVSLAAAAFAQDVPPDVLAKIRAPIEARYPDNFSMQKTLLNDQIASYRFLLTYAPEGITPERIQQIKRPIEARYPDNYSMQKTLLENQVASFQFLGSC